jgi:hypothetical protein
VDDVSSEESRSSAALDESDDHRGEGDGIGVVKRFNPRRTAEIESVFVSSIFVELGTSIP